MTGEPAVTADLLLAIVLLFGIFIVMCGVVLALESWDQRRRRRRDR